MKRRKIFFLSSSATSFFATREIMWNVQMSVNPVKTCVNERCEIIIWFCFYKNLRLSWCFINPDHNDPHWQKPQRVQHQVCEKPGEKTWWGKQKLHFILLLVNMEASCIESLWRVYMQYRMGWDMTYNDPLCCKISNRNFDCINLTVEYEKNLSILLAKFGIEIIMENISNRLLCTKITHSLLFVTSLLLSW